MAKDVLVNAGAGEVRVAVVEDGVLDQLWLERTIGLDDGYGMRRHCGARSLVGDVILGRVQRVLPDGHADVLLYESGEAQLVGMYDHVALPVYWKIGSL